jgi:hypothetical protein
MANNVADVTSTGRSANSVVMRLMVMARIWMLLQ